MTLKEIAMQANVSISTVSRVINGKRPSAASSEVQERIMSIARSSGYTPNTAAQSLKSGKVPRDAGRKRTQSVAVLFARTPYALMDPFFSHLMQSIEAATAGTGYHIKYMYSSPDFDDPSIVRTLMEDNLSGIIILGRCEDKIIKCIKQASINLVCVGLNKFDSSCDQILCDGFDVAFAAVDYLIKKGHRKIGYVGEEKNELRYNGYCAALEANGIPLDPDYTSEVILSSDGGYSGTQKILAQAKDITALFCANDLTAIGAMHALKESGYSIPNDISIIGIDDAPTSQYISPALTTMHIPIDEMGNMTMKILIDRINGGHTLPVKIYLPFNVVERESCI